MDILAVAVCGLCAIQAAPAAAKGPPEPDRATLAHVRRLVIDPGHGGDNLGALGVAGIREKALTLQASKNIAAWLRQHCDAEILLTRERDEALELRQRPRLANDWRGDALISVHANAHEQGEAAGMEVFFLAADASAEASRQLVEREEGPAAAGGGKQPWTVGGIKEDMEVAAAHARSQAFAYALGDALHAIRKKARFRGVRQAAFGVLKEAHMPALVLELGYITHETEGPQLLETPVHEEFAKAILRALVELDKRLAQERKAEATKGKPTEAKGAQKPK